MSDAVIVALISLIGTVVTVLVTTKNTQEKITNELHTQNEVQSNEIQHLKEKMGEMGVDLKEHNNYAKQLPEIQGKLDVIVERQEVANKRINDLESFQKDVTHRLLDGINNSKSGV